MTRAGVRLGGLVAAESVRSIGRELRSSGGSDQAASPPPYEVGDEDPIRIPAPGEHGVLANGPRFDARAATAQLDSIDLTSSCASFGLPRGYHRIEVLFGKDGQVRAVFLDQPTVPHDARVCASGAIARVSVPPYEGEEALIARTWFVR